MPVFHNIPRIAQMSVQLANQIAAGEVVERPASVVKELIENCLDAGATHIEIDIEQGGLRSIKVVDDGQGIHADDLQLALSRHATSKLSTLAELEKIASLGFRGEALPSIASVCRMQIISRQQGDEQASCIEVDAEGRQTAPRPAAHPVGTSVVVDEIFCNVPARRRFMRAAKTEFAHIQDVVQGIAMGTPGVAITLRHNGRQILRAAIANDAPSQMRRLAQVFGKQFVEQASAINFESEGLRLAGYIAPATLHRSQADRQYVFINGRMIRDRVINHAIRQAYSQQLPAGRYACYLLDLQLDPARIDVNVHPTKHEVRFRDSRRVHDFLYSAVHQTLRGEGVEMIATPLRVNDVTTINERTPLYVVNSTPARGFSPELAAHAFGQVTQCLHGHFILCQQQDTIWLLDARMLVRQVYSLRLRAQLTDAELSARPLLVPQRFHLTSHEMDAVEQQAEHLHRFGLEVSRIDTEHGLIRSAPLVLQAADPFKLLLAVIQNKTGDDETICEGLATSAAESLVLPQGLPALQDWLQRQLAMFEELPDKPAWLCKLTPAMLTQLLSDPDVE